jgi:hypothetical protein
MAIDSVPNLPFFYLVYRAWSHWRALSGGKHIQFLLDKNLLKPTPSTTLESLYSSGVAQKTGESIDSLAAQTQSGYDPEGKRKEVLLLHQTFGKEVAEELKVPELQIELERAIWQVENDMKAKDELAEEKERLNAATSGAKTEKKDQ